MSEEKSQVQKLLDLFVFAPAGLAQSAAEEVEKLAEKGRHRVEGQVHTARLVGQFAIQTARSEAKKMVGAAISQLTGGGGDKRTAAAPAATRVAKAPRAPARQRESSSSSSSWTPDGSSAAANGSSGADLSIPGYDSLSASQVVQRLDGLSRTELEDVKHHELSHRHRRTILNRVDQLLSGDRSSES